MTPPSPCTREVDKVPTEDLTATDARVSASVGVETPDSAVRGAFVFGWRMAELYDREDMVGPARLRKMPPCCGI